MVKVYIYKEISLNEDNSFNLKLRINEDYYDVNFYNLASIMKFCQNKELGHILEMIE